MPKGSSLQEESLQGHPVARGIAIGVPFVLEEQECIIDHFSIDKDQVESEIERYRDAICKSKNDIVRLKMELEQECLKDGVAVLEAHLQIIQDPLLNEEIEGDIRCQQKNAEHLFFEAIVRFRQKFEQMNDPLFQSRFEDVQDISKRVLAYLRKQKRLTIADAPPNSIVFSKTLSPSEAAEAKRRHVLAFVTELGGTMSHTAIVAKAKGIPYVTSRNLSSLQNVKKVKLAIVDGLKGQIIFNPKEETKNHYNLLCSQLQDQQKFLEVLGNVHAETLDGQRITVSANVEIADDFSLLSRYGAEGVGLFRSEYIVLQRGCFPTEDEQVEIYKSLLHHAKGYPVVIRAFDIGLDKVLTCLEQHRELNPALGLRAIRFLLHERALFKIQMRAILRASVYGEVKICFPMISCMNELIEAKKVVTEAKKELKKEGKPYAPKIKLGSMIEVPSAVMIVDHIAGECDFLSIGTNDLTQYALAVDRCNDQMSNLYSSAHPGVLRLINVAVRLAEEKNIPISVCGEIASDPRFVPVLIGLGVKELSCSCRFLPLIKQTIRHMKKEECKKLVAHILTLSSAQEIQNALVTEYKKNMPEHILDHF